MSENKISVQDYCSYYSIDTDFFNQLHQHGLLTVETENQQTVIAFEQLPDVEKYMHLHYDLDINMPGIEVIQHLLKRLQDMRQQLESLQNSFVTFH